MLPRRRKTNNLAQSLGRMSHVKSNTVTWLKLFDKQVTRDVPVAIHMHTTPTRDSLQPVDTGGTRVVATPLCFWPVHNGVTLRQVDVQVCCSFCNGVIVDNKYSVHHNYMLSNPYVLACDACGEKTLASK